MFHRPILFRSLLCCSAASLPLAIQAQAPYIPDPFAYGILSIFALPLAVLIFFMVLFVLKGLNRWNKKALWPTVVGSIFLGYIIAFTVVVP